MIGEGRQSRLSKLRGWLTWWGSPQGVMSLLVLVLLLGFALRLYRLGYQSIWYDEGVSIHLAMKDLVALTRHTAGDIHPPLYYYLLHFWMLAAGTSEFSAAFMSLVFGMLIIALSYRLARDLFGSSIGLLTALLVAISPFNVWYSQEIRMYTLGAFLGLVSLYCLTGLVGLRRRTSLLQQTDEAARSSGGGRGSLTLWIGYVLSAAAGLYTLYYFALLLLFESLFVLGWWLRNRMTKREGPLSLPRWLWAQGAVVLLYLPWLPIALHQAVDPPVPPWRGFSGLGRMVTDSWAALTLGQSVDPESALIWPVLSFLFAIYLLGLLGPVVGRQRVVTAVVLCGYTLVPLLMIYLLSLQTPLFHSRYVLTYSPPFYLLLALGFARLRKFSWLALAVGLVIVGGGCCYSIYNSHFVPQYAADDHKGAVRYLQERIAPGDAVLINAGYAYPPLLYYYEGNIAWRGRLVNYQPADDAPGGMILLQTGVIGGDDSLGWGDPESDFYATSEEETGQALERLFARHPRVWVYRIYDTVTDPQGFIRDWLLQHGRVIGDRQFTGESYVRVQCYLTKRELPYQGEITYHPFDALLDGQVGLLGYEGPQEVRAGGALTLTLHWQARRELETDYQTRVMVGLRDTVDLVTATEPPSPPTSQWQVGEVLSQTVSLEIPVGTPPLRYGLMLEMQDPATGRTLTPATGPWQMGTVTVGRPLVPPRPPEMTHEPWADFGHLLQLVGYELQSLKAEANDTIHVELVWRVWDAPLPLLEAVFQLADGEGQVWTVQEEGFPGYRYPTVLWQGEELVRSAYGLHIPRDLSPGAYELSVTLQRIRTMEQRETLPVWSSTGGWQERLLLGTIEVAAR